MKKMLFSGIIALVLTTTVHGADIQQALKMVSKQAQGALCGVRCKVIIADREVSRNGVGVCIDAASGLIMTQVVPSQISFEDVKEITLTPVGKDEVYIKATLQSIDTLSGLSFLRCQGKHNFSAVEFLSSANVSLGDVVISAGVNAGMPHTPLVMGAGYIGGEQYVPNRMFRITGGSLSLKGSVVFNAQGKGIGLVTATPYRPYQMYQRNRGAQTLLLRNLDQVGGFLPVDEFVQSLTNIPPQGTMRRPNWIGGIFVAMPESYREAKGLTGQAVMMEEILPGSPADKAGLKNRDVVVGIDGAPISSYGNDDLTATAMQRFVARMKAGQVVTLAILGDTGQREVKVKVEPMPLTPSEAPKLFQRDLGFVLREKVPFDMASGDTSAKKTGLLVMAVAKNSPAANGDLQTNDLVTAIDGNVVVTVDAAEKIINRCLEKSPPKDVSITVLRGDTPETLTIKPPK